MGQISVELSKRLSSAVDRMPAFPKSVQRILELTRDINCRPKDLVAVIEKDPVITIKVLKIIHLVCPDKEKMIQEVRAWQDQRNSEVVKVHWQFTTADARVKLKSLYPKIEV